MKQVNSFSDFAQLIRNSEANGYQVCLESSNIDNSSWPTSRFVDYIAEMEQLQEINGATLVYDSEVDANGRVSRVVVNIRFSSGKDYKIYWVVKQM